MADIQSNINVNIDTASAVASIKALQSQISAFQKEMAASSRANVLAAKNLQKAFIDDINATGKFSASIKEISSTADYFTRSLEKNKLSLGEYFRYGMGASKSFSKYFQSEFETINKVARERVKDLQTQYVSLGRDAQGALKAISIRPLALDMENLGTKTQIAAQRAQIFNQILKQGSTQLLNFGKNTQWAGRQLMVGFTIPLSIFGSKAAQMYKDMEEAAIKFRRVYGDATTSNAETEGMIKQIQRLGLEFTKYGVALSDTMELAGKAAAMGKTGADLLGQISQANTLSVLGGVDQQQALETTITLTNTFGYSTENLARKVDYLNAVENQTVLSIEDLTIAIPKAGPVIKQLGGDVEDLAVFMTAMKEGGINASEGANALKSGIASLINPTKASSAMLMNYGINLRDLISKNQGNVSGLVRDFSSALDTLDPTTRAQAIEKMFGKFQFSRISTLLQNISKDGTQAARALELSQMSAAQLAAMSRKELQQVENSPLYKFQQSIEKFKASMAPVGEEFMKMVTPLIEFGTRILDLFNNMSDGSKRFVTILVGVVGGLAPVFIMTFGLIANALANAMKGFLFLRQRILGLKSDTNDLGEQTQYMSTEQLEAATVAASLDQVHSKLIQTFTSEAAAIDQLRIATERAVAAQSRMGGVRAAGNRKAQNFADGGIVVKGPGGPKDDAIPANLSNGEVVLSVETVKDNPAVVDALLAGQKIQVPGYANQGVAGDGGRHQRTASSGYQQAHFSGFQQRTGAELLSTAQQGSKLFETITAKLEEQARHLGMTFDQVLDHVFQAYDNRVVNMSSKLNNLFGQSGKGGGIEAKAVKDEFGKSRGAAHGAMAAQLKKNGVADEEIKSLLKELADEVDKGLSEFGDEVLMTGEDLDSVIQKAYETVSNGNKNLKKAYDELSQISGFASEKRGKNGEITRLGITDRSSASPFYKGSTQRTKNYSAGVAYSETPEKSPWSDVSRRYFSDAQVKVFDEIRKIDSSISDAIIQEGDAVKRLAMLEQEARKLGIDIPESIMQGFHDGVVKVTDQASPSREAHVLGENSGQGYLDGAKSKIDDAQAVGEQAGDALARGAASRASLYGNAEITPALKAARRKFGSVENIPSGVQAKLGVGTKETSQEASRLAKTFSGLNGKIMGFSGIISTVSLGMQMFGVDLGSTGAALTNLSNIAFGLSAAWSQLSQLKGIQNFMGGLGGLDVAGMFKNNGIFKGIGQLGKGIFELAPKFFKLAGWVGVAILAFEGISWLMNVAKEQEQKITGLGDAANIASEKLNKFASDFGLAFAADTDFGGMIGGGYQSAQQQKAQDKGLSQYEGDTREDKLKSFASDYEAEINGLKGGTKQQAMAALQSEARKQALSGSTEEMTTAFIQTLIDASNDPKLKKINVGKEIIGNMFKPTADNVQALGDGISKTVDAYGKTAAKDQSLNDQRTANLSSGYMYYGRGGSMAGMQPVKSTETRRSEALLAGQVKGGAQALKNQFDTSKDKNALATYKKGIEGLINPLNKLKGAAKGNAISAIAKEVGGKLPDMIKKTNDAGKQILLLKLALSGNISPELEKKINSQTVTTKELTDALYAAQAAQDAKNKSDASAEAKAGMQDLIANNQAQIDTYYGLVAAGFAAADAVSLMGDASVQAAVAAGLAADQVAQLKGQLAELAKINASSGGSKENPFKDAIESLKSQIKESKNLMTAYSKLKAAGLSIATSWKYANDATVAAGLAAAKTKGQIKQIVDKIKELEKQLKANSWTTFSRNMDDATKAMKDQLTVTSKLTAMGASLEEIQALLGNEDFMFAFASGKVGAEQFAAALAKVREQAKIKLEIEMSTPEGMQAKIDEAYGKVQEAFTAQKEAIEIKYDAKMKSDKDIVKQAEEDIAKINYQIQGYEAGLQEISWKEDEINKRYEDRTKALDKIQKVNEEIIRQQKSQLTIADALSQGDIGAAARAIQESQAASATAAMQSQRDALDTAKEQELGSVTDSQGRNRESLEASILDLKKQIFTIEQEQLAPANERLRLLDLEKQGEIDRITVLGKTAAQWAAIKSEIDLARVNTNNFKTAIDNAFGSVTKLLAAYAKLGSKPGNVTAVAPAPSTTTTTTKPTTTTTTTPTAVDWRGIPTTVNTTTLAGIAAASGTTVDKLVQPTKSQIPAGVPSSALISGLGSRVMSAMGFNSGGRVPGAGNTDTVPSMLTPGEYVVNKDAVSKYGSGLLSAINDGSFNPNVGSPSFKVLPKPNVNIGPSGQTAATGSSSVYNNYTLSVNVKSDANPNEIAKVVMDKLRTVESQRVRGVRI
jgi:TP901 family phage tail tape measure protein